MENESNELEAVDSFIIKLWAEEAGEEGSRGSWLGSICNGPQKLDNISGFLRGKPPVVGIAARQLQTRLGLGIPKMNEYALSYKHRR